MGILRQMLARQQYPEQRGTADVVLAGMVHTSAAGVSVTPDTALGYAAVWACVRVLSQTIAALPLKLYERQGDNRHVASEFYLYPLLHDQPNPLMSSLEFREALQGHLLLWGNAYCEIEYDNGGRIKALWPLRPDRMESWSRVGDMLVYKFRMPDNSLVTLRGDRVWHLRGWSSDGLIGYSPIQVHRQAIGLGIAAEEYGARFFGNDARPGGVLVHPGKLRDDSAKRLQKAWHENYGGLGQSHRTAVLEEGVTYQTIGIAPDDAQFLETRKFQVSEIARIFGVPPHKIGDLDRATFSNIEHQAIEFVTDSLQPWLVRWEQSIRLQLMTEQERARYYPEFLVDSLLRGDTVTRYQAYAVARQNGWMSANDIRKLENMNEIDGGDVYLVPLNMVPADMVGAQTGDGGVPAVASGDNARATREKRSADDTADIRQRLMNSNKPLFEETFGRVCRRQAQDVMRAARKYLNQRNQAEFDIWLDTFLREHSEWTREQLLPLYGSYMGTAAADALQDVAEGDFGAGDYDIGPAARDYVLALVAAHIARSRRKVGQALRNEDQLSAMEAATGMWVSEWPEQMATRETARALNSAVTDVYKAAGVGEVRWVTSWGEKSCFYCDSLNGRTMAVGGSFSIPNLPEWRSVTHPPAHRGCQCTVVPA